MSSIRTYSIQQVQDWLFNNGFSSHMEVLKSCEVSGEFLCELTQAELTQDLGFTSMEAKKLLQAVKAQETGGYTPTVTATAYRPPSSGASSYTPSYNTPSTARNGGYVPSPAAMSQYSSPANHTARPSNHAVRYQKPPSVATTEYVPSAAAMAGVGTLTGGASAAGAGLSPYSTPVTNSQPYHTPSVFSAPLTQPINNAPKPSNNAPQYQKPPSAATTGYVPSAAAMAGAGALSGGVPSGAGAGWQPNNTPSLFSPPPTQPINNSPKPSNNAAQYQKPPSAATTGYVPSAAAMAGVGALSGGVPLAAGAGLQPNSTPSMFSPPPTQPINNAPKPSNNAAPHQNPNPSIPNQRPPNQLQQYSQPQQPQQYAQPQQQPQQYAQPQQYSQPTGVLSAEERQKFEANQPESLKQADIWMISGCEDSQTSADISNVNSFQLPNPHGRAGGACTAALLGVLHENDKQQSQYTFTDVMMKMRGIIKSKRLTQIPQLSSTHPIDMNRKFQIVPEGANEGRRRAVIIGINYKGQRGELRGCHNDAFNMQKYVQGRYGFQQNDTVMLIDDGRHTSPTRANILSAYRKVVAQSRPGDAIFLHYSGHGTKVRDENGDEEDGYDEAMVPLDFKRAGQIIDDELYKIIVQGLSPGVHVVAVMDCCHSGTILDLPYIFKANGQFSQMEVDNSFVKRNKLTSLLGKVGGALLVGGILNAIF